ncbi:secreted RxLR effector protein 161-like [Monomorium pharaonis]|uniref:secreted RxLR effector protein 161-like n=1 Tax=Monomorium pharaonis TaxID=307658 RepID=UPI00174680A0|nr:secreted RxLR effector protein 161-like [Monomorium pharaonis]
MDVSTKLSRNTAVSNEEQTAVPYRELVGFLMYIAMGSRPDIAHAVSCLICYNDCYQNAHWTVKRVLRYLRGTLDYSIIYKSTGGQSLIGFVNADWGSCPDDSRSYSGYVFVLGGGSIIWESRKQRTVALSSTEAQYMGVSDAFKEDLYLRKFVGELGLKILGVVIVLCDNLEAQKLALNPIFHSRTKHIDIRHHFVREKLESGEIALRHVSTEDMAADVLTKGLPRDKHNKCLRSLEMSRLPA